MRISAKLRSQRTLPVGKSNQDQKKFDLRQPKCLDGGGNVWYNCSIEIEDALSLQNQQS